VRIPLIRQGIFCKEKRHPVSVNLTIFLGGIRISSAFPSHSIFAKARCREIGIDIPSMRRDGGSTEKFPRGFTRPLFGMERADGYSLCSTVCHSVEVIRPSPCFHDLLTHSKPHVASSPAVRWPARFRSTVRTGPLKVSEIGETSRARRKTEWRHDPRESARRRFETWIWVHSIRSPDRISSRRPRFQTSR